MTWLSTIVPQASYAINPNDSDPGKASMASIYNIEQALAADIAFSGIASLTYGSPSDWPIPDLELTTRPKPAEVVQYADYTQRSQGPFSFAWGFRVMKPFVFAKYMQFLGFEKYDAASGAVYDYAPTVWTAGPLYVMTLDHKGTVSDYYRLFRGLCLRPVPGQHYKMAIGGNYENVIFRFVGCTESIKP